MGGATIGLLRRIGLIVWHTLHAKTPLPISSPTCDTDSKGLSYSRRTIRGTIVTSWGAYREHPARIRLGEMHCRSYAKTQSRAGGCYFYDRGKRPNDFLRESVFPSRRRIARSAQEMKQRPRQRFWPTGGMEPGEHAGWNIRVVPNRFSGARD